MTVSLTLTEEDYLRQIVREGFAFLGTCGVPVSVAIRLELGGFAVIGGAPQKVEPTAQGRAYARRVAA